MLTRNRVSGVRAAEDSLRAHNPEVCDWHKDMIRSVYHNNVAFLYS
jgi:hypothetical protein